MGQRDFGVDSSRVGALRELAFG